MARKPRPPKISYTLKVTEQGDVPRDPTLSKTSGLTFWVAPPSTPPVGDSLTTSGSSSIDFPTLDPLTDDTGQVLTTS